MRRLSFPAFLILSTLCVSAFTSQAQVALPDSAKARVLPKPKPFVKRPPRPRPMNREFAAGLQLNSSGYSLLLEKGYVRTEESGEKANMFYDVRSYSLEFTEYFSPSEIKSTSSSDPNFTIRSSNYKFGKANNFYAFKLGMNFRKMIAGKPEQSSVAVHWVNGGGLAIGLVKPYYVLGRTASGGIGPITYDGTNSQYFLDANTIEGKAPLSEGLKDITINPGLHAKSALRFDFANNKKRILALEAGVNAAYYFKPVAIMATKDAQSLYANVYVSMYFGKRYAGKERY